MIVNPVQLDEELQPAATFAGETLLVGTLSVTRGARATFAGETSLTGALSLLLALSADAAGSTALTGRLRLNGEPNVFLEGTIEGGTQFEVAPPVVGLTLSGVAAGSTQLTGRLHVKEALEFGFTVFLDIAGAAVTGVSKIRRYDARLTTGGASVPARRIVERAAPGALGVTLDVDLATPDRALVAGATNLEFQVGMWNGSGFDYVTLLTGGVRASDAATYANANQRPADRVSFGALDTLGDRWRKRPAAPATLYDPDLTEAPKPPTARDAIQLPAGGAIMPVVTAYPGLSLHAVLTEAYVTGCGFSKVVTNIADFPVASVTFSLEGGYHEAVKPLLGLFEPVYFADGDDLWIVDADQPLPAGLQPLTLTAADVKTIEDQGPTRALVDALILEYKDTSARGDYFTERVEEDDPEETGTFGEQGYTSTVTERRIREYRDFDAPEVILREETAYTKKTTTDYQFEVLGRETQNDTFDVLGRKSAHKRTVEARVPDLAAAGALSLQTVTEETYTIFYRGGPTPAADEIARTVSEEAGLVLVDADKPYLGKPYEIPFTDAHLSGYIDPDANQSTEFKAIRTVTETYVRQGAQTQVYRRPVNHLNGGTVEKPSSQTRAGTTAVARRAQGTIRRVVTLDGNAPTSGRVMPTFSAGEIPPQIALVLAPRKLRRLNNPPRPVTITLPYLEFRIWRGKLVMVYARGGAYLGAFVVEGYTRTYEMLDAGARKYSTTLNARQLTAAL